MPILEIEMVQPGDAPPLQGLAAKIADAAAGVLGSGPMHTWVRLRVLPASQYAENDGGPVAGVTPIFVKVLKARGDAGDVRKREAKELARAIGAACGRAVENVHILYEAEAAGRIAFGGELLE